MNMFRILFSTLVAAVLLAGCTQTAVAEFSAHAVFSSREAAIILEYYRGHDSQQRRKGKGLKSLPPGIAKNLRRGKPLPPGIAKQVLPAGLIDLLPPAPRGFERIHLNGRVLLVEIATQVIHDMLEDAVYR